MVDPAASRPLPPRIAGRAAGQAAGGAVGAALPVVGARMEAMLRLAPAALPGRSAMEARDLRRRAQPAGAVAIRPAAPSRCSTPGINEATIRSLTRHGVEVVLPEGEGCCGALVHHMGKEHDSDGFARANIDAWMREIEGEGLDAILITAPGCGTTTKDTACCSATIPPMRRRRPRCRSWRRT